MQVFHSQRHPIFQKIVSVFRNILKNEFQKFFEYSGIYNHICTIVCICFKKFRPFEFLVVCKVVGWALEMVTETGWALTHHQCPYWHAASNSNGLSFRKLKYFLTLKDMGFLVFQIHGGGWNPPILEKRSVTPPNFIPKQQTVSHMKAEIFS